MISLKILYDRYVGKTMKIPPYWRLKTAISRIVYKHTILEKFALLILEESVMLTLYQYYIHK